MVGLVPSRLGLRRGKVMIGEEQKERFLVVGVIEAHNVEWEV
jgi:hypothetical protein